jgi:hypothetical protein
MVHDTLSTQGYMKDWGCGASATLFVGECVTLNLSKSEKRIDLWLFCNTSDLKQA